MKNGIHPDYKPVVFVDANTGKEFVTRSTKQSAEKKVIDGVEYGVVTLEITSDTHPFWTGKQHILDLQIQIGHKISNKVMFKI